MARNGADGGFNVLVSDEISRSERLFAGKSVHVMDGKNRVTIPSRWRLDGGGEFFALPDPVKPAIGLLLEGELRELIEQVRSSPELKVSKGRAFMRQYFSQAFPCPVDRQGRMVLPAEMCREAGLADEVVLVGTGIRIEVWSPAGWEAEREQARGDYREVADLLGL